MRNGFAFHAVALIVLGCGASSRAADRPNIVLILTDDQGWSQTSGLMDPRVPASRSDYLETPNMCRLANEGMRFTSGYSPAPLCTPTRRSILCGTSAARSGSEFQSDWVPAQHMTIPKALKQADPAYRCAHFGKWGEQMISTPEECGYDISDGETGNITGGMPSSFGEVSHASGPSHFIDNDDPKRTCTVTDRAIGFMREQNEAKRPFYVQVSYYAVHLSVVCREETLAKYEAKGTPDRGYTPAWAAMMEELDAGVGCLLDAIDGMGIADNTYIFFTADNGGRGTVPGGDESRLPTNHPLTGSKHSLYEGGIRVPLLARGPGIEPGSVCRAPVVGYDFLPTFYALAGGKDRLSDEIDGGSFASLLHNPKQDGVERPRNALIFHRPRQLFSAVRQGPYKLMVHWSPKSEIVSRELYHVDIDPREETRDIAESRPAVVSSLEAFLLEYLSEVDAEKPSDVRRQNPRKKGR
jgi:arylsulfatase A-like enzyme